MKCGISMQQNSIQPKRNGEIDTATTLMSLETIELNENNQRLKTIYCTMLYIWNIQCKQIHRNRDSKGQRRSCGVSAKGHMVSFWGVETFCKYTKTCSIVCFKRVHCMLMNYISYHCFKKNTSILNGQPENKDEYSNNICVKNWKFINFTAHYSNGEMLSIFCVPDAILGSGNTEHEYNKVPALMNVSF